MQRPPTTVVVRRSRLSLACQALLALALAGYAGWWVDGRAAVPIVLVALTVTGWRYRSTPRQYHLRCVQSGERSVWESSADARAWQPETCRLVRLGPLLSAIDLSGRRLWLWPDSSDAHSLRHLRETLSSRFE
ncbi:protein YgfX [uncultured Salinicola sp.]|uniref:protein YgfX n=1 Tax=uncultured Salinicola sp. TaxID=1193542 RepID=UPI002618A7D0|nr:protein YgfX [uncultured Salinicola sp.]